MCHFKTGSEICNYSYYNTAIHLEPGGLVGASSALKLKVCHLKKGSGICNNSYYNSILAMLFNRMRLIVCLEESFLIYSIHGMTVMHTIRERLANPRGVCSLFCSNERCYLAYPAPPAECPE
ncbi:hypothetical protein HPB47_023565 [Ixodes persulcatus]|uniref:Uncharacterized protein n=1 Tax=Ixodes persulcatus TaxID=34615 RepID=A0AC60Q774_IXOPE|nr:hypothetical protein HPB47_023565 [Ixodes persulcatus]